MRYLAIMQDGSLQQTDKDLDQEDLDNLDSGFIDHIIKFDQELGFSRAIVGVAGEELAVTTWERIESI